MPIATVKGKTTAPQLKTVSVCDDTVLGVTMTDEIIVLGYLQPRQAERPVKKHGPRKAKNGLGTHPLEAQEDAPF